ncbi:TPA: methyl-accepting chemotaxis protein [Salmonella enterica]
MDVFKNLPIRITVMGIMAIMLLLLIADSLMLFTAESVTGWRHVAAAVIIVLAAAILIMTNIYLVRCLMKPLAELKQYLLSMADGNLNNRISLFGNNCVGQLYPLIATLQKNNAEIVSSIRSCTGNLHEQMRTLSDENSALAARTEQGAAAVVQTAASMEQLSATVGLNADNAVTASGMAREAAASAQDTGEMVVRVKNTMAETEAASVKINDITTIINSIAFQTNILALNASVEAARAGEQGRGFAVVATEVRNLAQRCAGSAKDIAALIASATTLIQEGVTLAGNAQTSMNAMTDSINNVSRVIGEIAVSSEEQSRGIQQARVAINEVDRITQQNNQMAEQSTTLVSTLQQLTEQLNHEVDLFRLPDNTLQH